MIDEILPLLVSEIRWDEDADASSTNINTISTFNGWEFLGRIFKLYTRKGFYSFMFNRIFI